MFMASTRRTRSLCVAEMELGYILWLSDPVTRESSDPETQLTRWPCSIMNSKCRLMCEKYSRAKEFLIIIGKSKSSLHGLTSSDFCPTTDTCNDFCHFSISNVRFAFWAFFRKPEKLGSHTGSKWWPGDPDVKDDPDDPLTRWPNDPVPCVVCVVVGRLRWRRRSRHRAGACCVRVRRVRSVWTRRSTALPTAAASLSGSGVTSSTAPTRPSPSPAVSYR